MHILYLSFLAIFIHELGHIVASRLVKVPLLSISLKPIGLTMQFDYSRSGYLREATVHLGGPIAGALIAILSLVLFREKSITFCGISAVLSVINLLPIQGFDGGGVLNCVLAAFFLPDTAEKISRAVSLVFLLFLWTAVLWIELRVGTNLSLLAFVLFFMIKVV